jgi:hypothetical protein
MNEEVRSLITNAPIGPLPNGLPAGTLRGSSSGLRMRDLVVQLSRPLKMAPYVDHLVLTQATDVSNSLKAQVFFSAVHL